MEARLFEGGTVPAFTTADFFASHPWIDPAHQVGHAERTAMVAGLIRQLYSARPFTSISDLGCGDGSLLGALSDIPARKWGYDAGAGNIARAAQSGLDVRAADILRDQIEYGELIVATEVVEHLVDPRGFVANLPGHILVLSSPAAETADWHYEHHAWAWDYAGYEDFVESAGWDVGLHHVCDGGVNTHGGVERQQQFQAITCIRERV